MRHIFRELPALHQMAKPASAMGNRMLDFSTFCNHFGVAKFRSDIDGIKPCCKFGAICTSSLPELLDPIILFITPLDLGEAWRQYLAADR